VRNRRAMATFSRSPFGHCDKSATLQWRRSNSAPTTARPSPRHSPGALRRGPGCRNSRPPPPTTPAGTPDCRSTNPAGSA
jgi:hypothetical protein